MGSFFAENWMLITVAFASGAMLVWPLVSRGGGAGALSVNGAVMRMNRDRAWVLDVGEPGEFAAGHVAGARNLPVGEFEQRLPETVKNKAQPLILVCATGARAGRCAAIARRLGYEQVQVLGGGMAAWREAGLPVEKETAADAGTDGGRNGKAKDKA